MAGQQTDSGSQSTRREVFHQVAALGVGSAVFQRALAAQAAQPPKQEAITLEMIQQAEWISGVKLSEEDRKTLVSAIGQSQRSFETLRKTPLPNSVPPALAFLPAPWLPPPALGDRGKVEPLSQSAPKRPEKGDDLAFLPVSTLAVLLRTRQVSSVELTKLYLERLHKFDSVLKCVVTFTDDLALRQAEHADREIGAGRYRGPLHGVPWGAKDLISYPGYKTTWGALPFKEQSIDVKATVARRLEEAGAVLVAKLTLGALAMGDLWFGGMTRNPWNTKQGSSGSSAGSASATVAGLVGFAIGSETLGSIVSPCRQCGASGLRPTFGRVSRHGCMTLSWSMDKLGPIARSMEDCALILGAIHGADGLDNAAVDRPFNWPCPRPLHSLRVGFMENAKDRPELKVLKELGVQLTPIKLPERYPVQAFDEVTRKGITEGLNSWPRTFRQGQFVPAVEYLRANRVRSLVMQEMEEVMSKVDLYVGGNDLLLTNLTGHPTAVLPNGFRRGDGGETPLSITFTGRLYCESELLAVANAFQRAVGDNLKHPTLTAG